MNAGDPTDFTHALEVLLTLKRSAIRTLPGLVLLIGACGESSAPSDAGPDEASGGESTDGESTDGESTDGESTDGEPSWEMVWSDEFSDDAIDAGNWSHEVNCFGGGNNERQCYTDRADNSFVADGYLHLVAKEEAFSGPSVFDDDPNYNANDASTTLPYTSARVRSKNLFDFKYGRVEFRAQVPGGQGTWPALWMLPTDNVYGGWPSSGEIDVFEAVNLNTDAPNEVHGTLHYGLPWPQWQPLGDSFGSADVDFTGEFHTYAVEWEADEIRWYFDDAHYQTQTSEGWYNYVWQGQEQGFGVANPRAPFDEAFHIIMNVAVGGDWPGTPDTGWAEDRQMLIDYVRVFQCSVGNVDGTGCKGVVPVDDGVVANGDRGEPIVNAFDVFTDGPSTFSFDVSGATVANTLQIQSFQAEEGNVVIDVPDLGGDRGSVLDITFSGVGNVFLTSGDMSMSGVEGLSNAFTLGGGSGWAQNGALAFDMLVESIDSETRLQIKLDSGFPNLGSVEIDTPEVGQWQRVVVSVADLLANPLAEGTGLDLNEVPNLFVIEPVGGSGEARLMLDDISLECAVSANPEVWQQDQVCGIEPAVNLVAPEGQADIFVDAVSSWDISVCCGGVEVEVLPDSDASRGDVVRFSYSTDTTVTFFQSSVPMDFSAYAGGSLEFDLFVEAEPVDAVWTMKTETFPAGTGDTPLTESLEGVAPTVGEWQHYTFNLDDLVAREGSTLDLARVQAPLVIFPAWGNQTGAVFRVDNVVMKEAAP